MTTKSMGYDHPAYQAVLPIPTGQINGNGGASGKFAAFTSMLLKSVTLKATTVGTSVDTMYLYAISGTTTTTNTLGTIGSGGSFVNLPLTTPQSLIQGDHFWVQKGTDATGTYVGAIESVIAPLANVTQ